MKFSPQGFLYIEYIGRGGGRGGSVNCPMDGARCLDAKVKYQATVVEDGQPDQHYVCVTEPPWKKRYGGHKSNTATRGSAPPFSRQYLETEGRGKGVRRQVEDLATAHHLQPHQQLMSALLVWEVHHHVSTGDGYLEPERRVLHSLHAQAEQALGQDLILKLSLQYGTWYDLYCWHACKPSFV